MTTFKSRDKKRNKQPTILTLDARHKEKIKYFMNLKKSLPQKIQELQKLKNDLQLEGHCFENYKKIINIQDKMYELKKEIIF